MRWIYKIPLRLRSLFQRSEVEHQLDAELRFHLEQQIEENLAAGMSQEDAQRVARRAFGNVGSLKEETRDAWGIGFVETLRQDLRFAGRSFRRSPAFTGAVLVTLALGIGVGTAIFSIVNAVLLQPLPYRDPSRLVALVADFSGPGQAGTTNLSMGGREFLARRELSTTFEKMAAYRYGIWKMESEQGWRILSGVQVSEGFFDLLSVEPALGRRFFPEDHRPGADLALIVLDEAWRTQFNADPAVIGRRYRFWQTSGTIVGVMPPGFVFAKRDTAYLMPADLERYKDRPFHYTYFRTVARLTHNASIEQAQAEQDVLTAQFKQQYPEYPDGRAMEVLPLSDESAGEIRPALYVLFGAVAFVMLIVCANVANLLLGRALARRQEIGVRAALGAGRTRLVRQLLTESLILSVVGGAIGFGLANIMVGYFQAIAPERGGWGSFLVQADSIQIDATTFGFALSVTIVAGLAFGIAPALQASRLDLSSCLKSGSRATGGSVHDRFVRNALVVVQTALAFVLVCGAGLLIRSLLALYDTGPGFQSRNRLQMTIMWSPVVSEQRLQELRETHDSNELRLELGLPVYLRAEALRERLRSLPGVRDVAFSALPAMAPRPSHVALILDPGLAVTSEPCEVIPKFVSHNFFSVMGIPVLRGRGFQPSDRLGAEPVIILSRQAARECAGGADVVGSEAHFEGGWVFKESLRVVGVAGDVRYEGIDAPGERSAYAALPQVGAWNYSPIVHTSSDPRAIIPEVREAILEMDPNAAIWNIWLLDRLVQDSAWKLNYSTMLLGGLAALSLLLAAVGVYAVLSETTRRRTSEIGLRMALGASRAQILGVVLWQGLGLVGVGIVIGLLAAAGLTRFLGSLLFGVEPLDPWTFAVVAAVLLGAALPASYIPGRRAAQVDPLTALRYE